MKRNAELRAQAYMALEGNWKIAAIITLVYFLIGGGIQCGVDFVHRSLNIISILLMPIVYGYSIAFLALVRGEELYFERLFDGFKDYGRVLGTLLLTTVYTLLWTLLLIIPGIVKGYSYALTNYILKDEPQLRFNGAIEKSMDMMSGYKMKLFLMDLSFIGWAILCLLTLGIGFLFLTPYVEASHAAFYLYVKEEYMKDQVVEY